MEYNYPFLVWLGAFGALAWSLDYFNILKKPILHIPIISKDQSLFNIGRFIVFLIGFTGWCFITYSLTQPRLPQGFSENEIDVNDIFVVVDVSHSMEALDFKPNRLEAAKEKIQEFVALMPTDRIGIIVFSEKVFTLLPLTTDLALVKRVVGDITTGPLGSGTNIGDAIGLATARAADSEAKNKVIVLLTDGVSNVGSLTPIQAGEEAEKLNIKIYSIGIGGDKDAQLPLGNSIFGPRFRNIPGGSFDFETLKKISDMTGGKAYHAKNPEALKDVLGDISTLEKTKIKSSGKIIYKELFYQYLFIGVFLFLLSEIIRRFWIKEFL